MRLNGQELFVNKHRTQKWDGSQGSQGSRDAFCTKKCNVTDKKREIQWPEGGVCMCVLQGCSERVSKGVLICLKVQKMKTRVHQSKTCVCTNTQNTEVCEWKVSFVLVSSQGYSTLPGYGKDNARPITVWKGNSMMTIAVRDPQISGKDSGKGDSDVNDSDSDISEGLKKDYTSYKGQNLLIWNPDIYNYLYRLRYTVYMSRHRIMLALTRCHVDLSGKLWVVLLL